MMTHETLLGRVARIPRWKFGLAATVCFLIAGMAYLHRGDNVHAAALFILTAATAYRMQRKLEE